MAHGRFGWLGMWSGGPGRGLFVPLEHTFIYLARRIYTLLSDCVVGFHSLSVSLSLSLFCIGLAHNRGLKP